MKNKRKNTLIIPDIHFPFHHKDLFKFLRDVKRDFHFDVVIQLGDLLDGHRMGRWIAMADSDSADAEMAQAISLIHKLVPLFPEMLLCYGNHDLRIYKRMNDAGIPTRFAKDLPTVLGTPTGWQFASEWEYDGVLYTHGDGFSGKYAALRAAESNRMSTVIGHIHSYASVMHTTSKRDKIFGMSAGCLIDCELLAFEYGKHFPNKPVLGCGVIIDGIPAFIPMEAYGYGS